MAENYDVPASTLSTYMKHDESLRKKKIPYKYLNIIGII